MKVDCAHPDEKQKIASCWDLWSIRRIEKYGVDQYRKMERERIKAYYRKHPEKLKSTKRKSYLKHREKRLAEMKGYYAERGHIYRANEARRRRTPEGRKKRAIQMRLYRKNGAGGVIVSLRNRLHRIIKSKAGLIKNGQIRDFVGCSRQRLEHHLQSKWKEGMSWDNYGRKEGHLTWHVDHIVPYAHFREDFDSGDPARIKKASALVNHYTNLFPMWGPENAKKGGRLPEWVLIMGKTMSSDLHEMVYQIPADNGEEIETDDSDR